MASEMTAIVFQLIVFTERTCSIGCKVMGGCHGDDSEDYSDFFLRVLQAG